MPYQLVLELNNQAVAELQRLYAGEWWSKDRTLPDVRRMLAGTDLVFALVDEESGTLAAFARVLTDGVYKAFVFDVIVDKPFRGQGLGEQLMRAVLDHPEVKAARHVELYCLPELAPFYARWGFVEVRDGVVFLRRTAGP